MENHPIPQDVTGFQFKLIGNMTVKQFAYIAACSIFAWIIFSSPLFILLKLPFVFISLVLGISLAFLPLEGRPFDLMLMLFIKSLFNPNQFLFQKEGLHLFLTIPPRKKQTVVKKAEDSSKKKLEALLRSMPKGKKNKMDEKEMVFFESLGGIFNGTLNAGSPPKVITMEEESEKPVEKKVEKQEIMPNNNESEMELELEKEAIVLKKELEKVRAEESGNQSAASGKTHEKVLDLERQLNEVLAQRESLERQLLTLKQKLTEQTANVFVPSQAKIKEETKNVRNIPKAMGKSIGLPIAPDVANLIIGIVKDPRGNVLPNILVEIKDKDGNPVRAFKTNGLGQFASATPLLNGVYTILFEDPGGKNKFDTVELTLSGEIIPVIEINSVDQREELRKALFNG